MGSMLQVIWQLINLCTIAAVLAVPGSSGSILQSPAASSSVKSPLLDQSIKGSLPFLSRGQSTTPPSEHGSSAAVPAQPLQTVPITTETPHVSTAPPAAEPPLVSSQPTASYSSNDSSLTPASDASPGSTPRLAVKAPGALAPLSNAHSLPLPPLMAHLPLEGPPCFPSPALPDAQPHTSGSPLAAMSSNPRAPLPLAEPPRAVNVPPSEAQPFLPSPSPAATMQSPVSPNGSPPLPQQVPSHAFPLPLPREAPSIIPSPLPEVPPHASVMPLPPFLSNASSPLHQQVPSRASALPLPRGAPENLPSPLPAVLPHASVMPSPPFLSHGSSHQPQQVPSLASALPPSQEASPIKPSPLPAVLPYAPVMLSPPFLSNAYSPVPQEFPSHASLPPLPQEALPITPTPLPAVLPHASVMPSPQANASSPLPQQVPSHAFSLPSPQEAPLIKSSPLPAVPPHASVTPLPAFLSNASSPLSQLIPSGSSPPDFIVPSHAFVPPPLMEPLPEEPPPSFPSPFPPMPPYASTFWPPPGPPNASSPQPQLVPSHPVPPKFITSPLALVPPPLTEPLSIEPPAILPSPTLAIPPAASVIPLPSISPHASSPPLQLVLSQASPPYFKRPSHTLALPPLMMPLPKEPPSILPSTIPPSASTMQSPPLATHKSSPFSHPAPPQASPRTFLVPPHLIRPPHAFSMPPPPIELPDNFPPPSSTLPGAMPPHAFPPPTMSPPFAPAPLVVPSPPSEKLYSYAPPAPTMQGTVPAAPPHASQRKETQNAVPPPVPTSLEPLPASVISPKGAPSVHEVMPRSQPPFSHQIEIPSGSPFRRSNASVPHLPPLSGPAPSNNPISSGIPLAAPPSNTTISSGAPLTAPPGSITSIAPSPFSSQVHPPSVRLHYSPHHSPLEGPSNLAPMPAAFSPRSSTSEGSRSSAFSPSLSIHEYPREGARSPASASVLVPPPAPSQQGQVESPFPLCAPKPSPAGGQQCNPSSPPSQGSPVAVVPSSSPSRVPELSPVPSKIPFLSPKISPSGSSTRNTKRPLAPPIRALPPPPPNQDCAYLTCQEPYTNTPPGSLCGCVWPMQVGLRLSVALYTFFPLVSELATEIAAAVFMNQSQVRIMGADAAGQEPEKTIVLIDLVPLNDKFDYATAMSTSQRFWHKKVAIDKSIFGDYDVLYVRYPGLPPSPPMAPDDAAVVNSMPYFVGDPNGSKLHPLGVDVAKQRYQHKLSGSLIAVIVFSSIVVVLICSLVAWVLISRYTNDGPQSAQVPPAVSSLARLSGPTGDSHGSGPSSPLSFGSSLAAYTGSARTFSAREIEKATGYFDPSGILGEGGFGCVYRGILEDGTSVAVKVLKREDQQGSREFLAEVEMLSRLHHRNLVKLIGICVDERMRCLVYELVPNGSVDSHLHGADKEAAPLDWVSRLKVALGAARGLAYLHEDSSPRVIHRDFKSSNILLENDFTPKVSDFGLARTALDEENRHISTRVMGTFGYVAPEYAMTGHLLVKSDVYSYGVVLLELLTGRKPVDMSQPPGQENLVAWARPFLTNKEGLESIIDPSLGPNVPLEAVAKVAAIASMCVQPEVSHRPFMGEVVQALKLVCNECGDSKDGEDSRSLSRENLSVDFDADVGTSPVARETPDILPARLSSHGFPPGHDLEKGLSVSEIFSVSARADMQTLGSFRRHSASGPMRTSKGPRFWQKIRGMSQGSVSEHGIMYRSWAGS